MLRLPVVEMAAEPAPPPVAAGYEPHPVGTGERIRFLERVNAELVGANLSDQQIDAALSIWFSDIEGFRPRMREAIRAALTSATKEQQK